MNAMSVSPVKPPLNPGNLAVPTVPTNLSKTTLPSSNNYAPLNLMPDAKPVAPVTITPLAPEKSVDLCAKPPQPAPTSNGTVSPIPESNEVTVISNAQHHAKDCETAENLSTTHATAKPEIGAIEPPKIKNDVEEKIADLKKATPPVGETSTIAKVVEKEAPAQTATANEIATAVENIPAKGEEKKDPATTSSTENIQNNFVVTPTKKEPVPEASKPEPSPKKDSLSVTPIKCSAPSSTTTPDAPKTPEAKADKTDAIDETKPETPAKSTSPKTTKRKAKALVDTAEEDTSDGRKSKRTRLPTQPYQSPIPELQLIAKLNTPTKATPKNSGEKIIAFYKNEFLAVRNPEGSFYICQAFQNIHRSSSKIKIRWFTNLPQNIYTPDFYDTTGKVNAKTGRSVSASMGTYRNNKNGMMNEFDCILTNVIMNRMEKDRWKLPDEEHTRIENILKRALDVEKGVAEQPSVTEEHPDGLDLSLFKDEAQLQKKKKQKKTPSPKKVKPPVEKKPVAAKATKKPTKAEKPAAATTSPAGTKKSARLSSSLSTAKDTSESKVKTADKPAKKGKKDKKKKNAKAGKKTTTAAAAAATTKPSEKTSSKTWEPSVKASNSSRVVLSLRKEDTSAKSSSSAATAAAEPKIAAKRMSSVSLKASAAAAAAAATLPPPTKRRKEDAKAAATSSNNQAVASDRPGKVRNAGSAVTAKINSAAMRTTKDKERKTATSTNQRKK